MKIKFALIVATLFAAQAAVAGDVYVGAGVGQARAHLNTPGATHIDNKDRAGKIFVGTQLNRNFGLEASYADLGDFTANSRYLSRDTDIRAGALDLVTTLPLTERFSVISRLGVARTAVREDFGRRDAKNTSNNLHAGIGAQYKLSEKVALRGEFESYRVKDTFEKRGHVNLASASLVYKFGRPAPTKVAYVAPAPVYVAPAPAPVAAPAPAPVVEAPVVTKKKIRE